MELWIELGVVFFDLLGNVVVVVVGFDDGVKCYVFVG